MASRSATFCLKLPGMRRRSRISSASYRLRVVSYLSHKHDTFRAAGIFTEAEFAVAPDIKRQAQAKALIARDGVRGVHSEIDMKRVAVIGAGAMDSRSHITR